jgi:Putative beta barrel porin-7 (BBP7)
MLNSRAALLSLVCLLSPFGLAHGQSVSTPTSDAPREGMRPGYIPAHLKHAAKWQVSVDEAAVSAEETNEGEVGEIVNASYGEHILGNPPLPPGFEGEVIEFGEDVKGGKLGGYDASCYWGRAEYLLWWTKGMESPPLVTTSPAGTAQAAAGVLGQAGTSILFGNNDLVDGSRSGAKITFGRWLDSEQRHGVEANYMRLGSTTDSFNAGLNDFNILARPFFDTVANAEDSRLIAFPGLVQGTLNVAASTELQSFELLYRHDGRESWGCHIDWIAGYRFVELKDRLGINESTTSLSGPTTGTTFALIDQFDTRSTFHGAEFGLAGDWEIDDCWSIETIAKVAIGGNTYRSDIAGQTTTTDTGGGATTAQGGLLTQGTNIGNSRWTQFGAISEFGLTLRREWAYNVSTTFGYNFLYWSNVARASEQVDTTVNTSQIPPGALVGTARPTVRRRTNDFWAQGLRFGLEYRY